MLQERREIPVLECDRGCGGNPGPKEDQEDHEDVQRRAKNEGRRDVRQVRLFLSRLN